jgi:hypothetical protein
MQTKTTLRFYLTLIRTAIIKKQTTDAGKDVGRKELSCIVAGNVN